MPRSVERSSDQVVRPVNLDALDKWVGQVPADVRADMAELAPMLSVLGYDPWANPPRYAAAPDLAPRQPPDKSPDKSPDPHPDRSPESIVAELNDAPPL